ncbi:MAG: GNAT family N-acetyltransferase [Lachnospiraceae bacterium]|nr:GNAT family N-acetyltransferase [Lachnospiraceae bacterium]
MADVYEKCSVIENECWELRLVTEEDAKDLVKVYRDKNALPFFNSDNCHGDNFYYRTEEQMHDVIKGWLWEYARKGFVRFAIIEKRSGEAIGTVELFNRVSEDSFNGYGILRLDVRSDYEREDVLSPILSLITEPAYTLFSCTMIATKAAIYAVERVEALKKAGFEKTDQCLVGHDGTTYRDYWVRKQTVRG